MSFEDLLNITCDIYSKTKIQDDVGGSVETLTLKQANVPCRIVRKSANERTLLGREGVVSSHTIYMQITDTIKAEKEDDVIKIVVHTIIGTTIAFVDSNPDTITDSGNGFITAGFVSGSITVLGSTSNDGSYTIDTVAAGILTLISTDTLSAEVAGDSVTITQLTQYDIIHVTDWALDSLYLRLDVMERK